MIHTIQHDGDPVDIEISHCNLHMDGEFAGNFDLLVSTKPALEIDTLLAHLRWAEEDAAPIPLHVTGQQSVRDGHDLTLVRAHTDNPPAQATFWWDGQRIGQVPVKQIHEADYDDSERFEHPPKQGCGTAVLLLGAGLLVPLASRLLDWTP